MAAVRLSVSNLTSTTNAGSSRSANVFFGAPLGICICTFLFSCQTVKHRCINTPMTEALITTKITPSALQAARMVAAKTGEKQYEAIQRVLTAECVRLGLVKTQRKPK